MIGNRLKEFRKAKNLKQQPLAKQLETSSGYISEIESGKTTPGANFLISLKREFNVNINWLLTGEGEMLLKEKDKLPPSEDLNLVPEIKDLLEDLKNATNKAINLNKLIYTPPPQTALTVREEKVSYDAPEEKIPIFAFRCDRERYLKKRAQEKERAER